MSSPNNAMSEDRYGLNLSISGKGGQADFSEAMSREKLNWYREVLEVEPASRVFLPYARQLAAMRQRDEAINVLRRGLKIYPDVVEARLLLIEELYKSGGLSACAPEAARLASLFRDCTGFWSAWNESAKSDDSARELNASSLLLGAVLKDPELSLHEVLTAGLASLRGDKAQPPAAAVPEPDARGVGEAVAPEVAAVAAVPEKTSGEKGGVKSGDELFTLPDMLRNWAPHNAAADDEEEAEKAAPAVRKNSAKCSLRTRSMAEILAEQGDIPSAIEIYEELAASARPDERAALQRRIDSLHTALISGYVSAEDAPVQDSAITSEMAPSSPVAASADEAESGEEEEQSARGVLDMLENLAVHLENRAR